MISQIDEALRSLIRAEGLDGAGDVEVVLDAPTKDWAARRNAPTVNLYLYDLREDLRMRATGRHDVPGDDGLLRRLAPPRYFKMSYLLTAWTQRPEDEHRLLAGLLGCFLRYDALPAHVLPRAIADGGLVVPLTVGLPPPEDRAFADVWTALGGELKPSLDLVVIAPMAVGIAEQAGPPVQEGMVVSMIDTINGGSDDRRQKHVPLAASGDGGGAGRGGGGIDLTAGRRRARKRSPG